MISQEVVDQFKRERVARAFAAVVCDVGPTEATVASVCSRGKVARNTFYELFKGSADAYREALDLGSNRLRAAIDHAAMREGPWGQRVREAVGALLEAAAVEPELSELALRYLGAAPDGRDLIEPALVETLAGILRPGREFGQRPGPGACTEELVALGILSVIGERLRRREPESLPGLKDDLTGLAVGLFAPRGLEPQSASSHRLSSPPPTGA